MCNSQLKILIIAIILEFDSYNLMLTVKINIVLTFFNSSEKTQFLWKKFFFFYDDAFSKYNKNWINLKNFTVHGR